MDVAAKLIDVFSHEADDGTYDRKAINDETEAQDARGHAPGHILYWRR